MSRRRLAAGHLHIGSPLPFDAFDDQGNLLLRKGFVIESERQLEQLVERGLYSDAPSSAVRDSRAAERREVLIGVPEARPTVRVSVFGLLDEVTCALAGLLDEAETPDFPGKVLELAGAVQRACALDADAAIAVVQLKRDARFPVRYARNVAIVTEVLLQQMETTAAERLAAVAGALTMNIAMTALEESLYHREGSPSEEEQAVIRAHPAAGAEQLRARGVRDEAWLDIVLKHHEAIDGSGYPAGLAGEAVPLAAQVVSLADRYCTMISGRATRPGELPHLALREIFLRQGGAIATGLGAILIREMGMYPPGTLVGLANGEIAIAVKRTLNANQPVVRSLLTPNGVRHPDPPKRLTSSPNYAVSRVVPEAPPGVEIDCEKLWSLTVTEAPDAGA